MVDTVKEILEFLKLFNKSDPVFKAWVADKEGVPDTVTPGEYVTLSNMKSGAIGNAVEYERRLASFLIDMLDMSKAQGDYVEGIAETWMNNSRPLGYNDQEYIDYVQNKILAYKESAVSLIVLLQPFSSEPVLIFEPGEVKSTMFAGMSFAGHYELTRDNTTGELVSPAILGGSEAENTKDYYFRAKLQPIDAVAANIINILLRIGHVAGVRYDIELYAPFP